MTLVLGVALAVGGVSSSAARRDASICLVRPSTTATASDCPLRLESDFEAAVTPPKLPKEKMAPIAVEFDGKFSSEDGTPPPVLQKLTIELDRDGRIDARGLAVCPRSALAASSDRSVHRLCRDAIVGNGTVHVSTASGERVRLLLTLFNGGIHDGKTTMFVRAGDSPRVPAPRAAVLQWRPVHDGRYGLRATMALPPIADGGSVLDFHLNVRRSFDSGGRQHSYAVARCSDEFLFTSMAARFANGMSLEGTVVRPCEERAEAVSGY